MDPYKVLGISQNTDEDDVVRSYRLLCQRYHPDNNINNPRNEESDEKFMNIQTAFDEIVVNKSDGFYHTNYGNYFDGFGSSLKINIDEGGASAHLNAIANNIHNNYFKEANDLLDITEDKSALWYYLKSHACLGLDLHSEALENARMALSMEPENFEYNQYYSKLSDESYIQLRDEEAILISSDLHSLPIVIMAVFPIILIILAIIYLH
ncbi:MAG: J domain-containing protein [Lachnospiraceae bacterium]|nr:J domain-containing protein [Lachnospiraceae bacterium]